MMPLWLKTVALWKRKSVSTLPSCRKPKPRIWSPWKGVFNGSSPKTSIVPNMPTFWYMLRRCGILMICSSFSKLAFRLVPNRPRAGLSS